MKKVGFIAVALVVLVAFAGCDLFNSLDVADVKDLPSYESEPVKDKDGAYTALMGSGFAMSEAGMDITESIATEISGKLEEQNAAFAANLFVPSFSLQRDAQVTFDETLEETGDNDKGTTDGNFELIIENEQDANNSARVDGESSGSVVASWDGEATPATFSGEVEGSADFLLELLKDQAHAESDYIVKSGSKAHFIADVFATIDAEEDGGVMTGNASYDTAVQFGYTMTIDGVDGAAGKYVLMVDLSEAQSFDFDSSNPDSAVTEVQSEVDQIGTLTVYDNDNNVLLEEDLTSEEITEVMGGSTR